MIVDPFYCPLYWESAGSGQFGRDTKEITMPAKTNAQIAKTRNAIAKARLTDAVDTLIAAASVDCPLFPVVPPLTPAQTYLIEYGYTEEQTRNFAHPDYVARSHGWNAGGEKSVMTNAEWSMRARASVERDNEIARNAQAKRAAQNSTNGIEVTSVTVGAAKLTAAGKAITPKKEARMLYGHSYTACIRWMGLKGFTVEEVVKVLGADQVKEASIKNIMAGAVKLNGLTVATLTDAQGEELMTIAGKVAKKIPTKVSPKKTQGKK